MLGNDMIVEPAVDDITRHGDVELVICAYPLNMRVFHRQHVHALTAPELRTK